MKGDVMTNIDKFYRDRFFLEEDKIDQSTRSVNKWLNYVKQITTEEEELSFAQQDFLLRCNKRLKYLKDYTRYVTTGGVTFPDVFLNIYGKKFKR